MVSGLIGTSFVDQDPLHQLNYRGKRLAGIGEYADRPSQTRGCSGYELSWLFVKSPLLKLFISPDSGAIYGP